jgi:hypothetical protein
MKIMKKFVWIYRKCFALLASRWKELRQRLVQFIQDSVLFRVQFIYYSVLYKILFIQVSVFLEFDLDSFHCNRRFMVNQLILIKNAIWDQV